MRTVDRGPRSTVTRTSLRAGRGDHLDGSHLQVVLSLLSLLFLLLRLLFGLGLLLRSHRMVLDRFGRAGGQGRARDLDLVADVLGHLQRGGPSPQLPVPPPRGLSPLEPIRSLPLPPPT